jgi:hypothetical protein
MAPGGLLLPLCPPATAHGGTVEIIDAELLVPRLLGRIAELEGRLHNTQDQLCHRSDVPPSTSPGSLGHYLGRLRAYM